MHKARRFIRGVMAGIVVSIGCMAYLQASSEIAGSILFSFSLLVVCVFNLDLYTGKVYTFVTANSNNIGSTTIHIIGIWYKNIIGTYLTTLALRLTRFGPALAVRSREIVEPKLRDGPVSLFILGIGCNILIYLAIRCWRLRQDLVGCVMVIMCTTSFLCAGFEHCIADGFFLYMGDFSFTDRFTVLIPTSFGNVVGAILPAVILEHDTIDDLTIQK